MSILKLKPDESGEEQSVPLDEENLTPLPVEKETLKSEWQDPNHEYLQVEILDVDGAVLSSAEFPAPVNTNAEHPCWIRVSVGHADGCYRVLSRKALDTY